MNNTPSSHHAQVEFSQITPMIFLGTNLCCTLKPHIQILLDLGITAEINLEIERTDAVPDVPIFLWLPVIDRTAPSMDQIEAGVGLIDQIVNQNKKVYVHCQFGHGRSPTLVAAYLIFLGKTALEAISAIKLKRPEIHLEAIQQKLLEDYSLLLISRRR